MPLPVSICSGGNDFAGILLELPGWGSQYTDNRVCGLPGEVIAGRAAPAQVLRRGVSGGGAARKSNGTLDQVLLNGIARSGCARGDPQLAVDRGQVEVDGARADDELLGDLGVGYALGNQA